MNLLRALRHYKAARFAAWVIFFASTVSATVSVTSQARSLAITRVNVVDVINGRVLPNSTVTISGLTIVSVTANGAPQPGAQVVDGQGKFLIPGLWDMHAQSGVCRNGSRSMLRTV
jgi:imidazolonepropionase-like amidohydrolase